MKRNEFCELGTGPAGIFGADLQRLIETKALVQANSGGGKSYLIRKILEQTHGKVQQIVLDVEGEFSSLRTKYDYILAGKGGDVAADPRTADLLARKLLELGADCIIDLFELKSHEQRRFVRVFLESLMSAPKDLWHPVIVVVDEAQLFAPEAGKSEALEAVIDLCTRGRKRDFCAILATLRISMVHKDALAQCLNKLIGRTALDIDRKRAADELGFTTRESNLALRDLDPGEFYAFGPALSKSVQKVTIGKVSTPHGHEARKALATRRPAPTEKVKKALEQLGDLPKEAEEEIRDRDSLRARVRDLEREIATAKRTSKVEIKTERVVDQKSIDRAVRESMAAAVAIYHRKLKEMAQECAKEIAELKPTQITPALRVVQATAAAPIKAHSVVRAARPTGDDQIGQCERRILGFLSIRPGAFFSKVQIGAMTGYSHGSGGFNNALSKLSTAGMIQRNGTSIALNPSADVAHLIDQQPHRLEDWIAKLGACERKVYERLLKEPSSVFSKDEIASETGYSAGSGGFNNALSRLSTLGLVKREHGGQVRINPEVVGL